MTLNTKEAARLPSGFRIKPIIIAFLLGFAPVGFLSAILRHARPDQYSPQYTIHGTSLGTGAELNAILLVSSRCPVNSDFRGAIERMKLVLARRARALGYRFAVTAVVIDWSPANANSYIKNFGRFDELILGKNWLNSGVVQYVWGDPNAEASAPQVVIVRRSIIVTPRLLTVNDARVLGRHVGMPEIEAWVRSNLPVAGLTTRRS